MGDHTIAAPCTKAINTAIIGPGGRNVGIGFAVPVRMAKAVMKQLLRFGEVRRGRLGVAIQEVTPDIAAALGLKSSQGAIVSRVDRNSSAQQEGIEADDVIIAVNGETLRNSADLRNRVGLVPMGEEVTLTTIRNGKRIEHKANIGKAGVLASAKRDRAPQLAGSVVIEMDREHGLFGKVAGVVVAQSEPGSPAWRSGLRKGDVIIAVNQQPTPNLEAFGKAD